MSRSSTAERTAVASRRVEKVYGVLAGVYDACFDWALGPGRRRAVAELVTSPGDRVLEIGVGTGLSLPHYPAHCQVSGIDISEPMLEQARERVAEQGLDVDLRVMDARDLQYPDATFDHVLVPYVVSVVPDPKRVMAEASRVCKPGGTVIVVNHFGSANPVMRSIEKAFSPASQWIGFRLDEPIESVTRTPGLDTVRIERVNLLGLWRLVELQRRN